MTVEKRREVQTGLLTHTVRLEMQMAKLAVAPPSFSLPGLELESSKCTTVQVLASLVWKFNFL